MKWLMALSLAVLTALLLVACDRPDIALLDDEPETQVAAIPSAEIMSSDLTPESVSTVTASTASVDPLELSPEVPAVSPGTPSTEPIQTRLPNGVDDATEGSEPASIATSFWEPEPTACTLPDSWTTYTVKFGDTLSQIAELASITVEQLITVNCLDDPDKLVSGQILYVPQVIDSVPTQTSTATPDHWVRYADPLYQVSFDYPATWQNVSQGLMIKLLGDDGFVRLAALGSPYDLNKVAEDQAFHKLQPYGHSPVVEVITLQDGREARLIIPSEGQLDTLLGEALLIAPYAELVPIGNYRHNYLALAADVGHIRRIAQSLLLPPPPEQIGIQEFVVEVEDLSSGAKRLSLTWDSFGATRGLIVSGTAERFAPWWLVEAFGKLTVDLNGTIFADPVVTLRVFNDVSGREASEAIRLSWPCANEYFFSPSPERCPRGEPLVITGAFQPFERGFMIWVPKPGSAFPSIYAFQDSGRVTHYQDTWSAAEPESDLALDPPAGLHQPLRGFGKVWREHTWLQDELGWATVLESEYLVIYQVEARESIPGVSYLTHPDGAILQIVGLEWNTYAPG